MWPEEQLHLPPLHSGGLVRVSVAHNVLSAQIIANFSAKTTFSCANYLQLSQQACRLLTNRFLSNTQTVVHCWIPSLVTFYGFYMFNLLRPEDQNHNNVFDRIQFSWVAVEMSQSYKLACMIQQHFYSTARKIFSIQNWHWKQFYCWRKVWKLPLSLSCTATKQHSAITINPWNLNEWIIQNMLLLLKFNWYWTIIPPFAMSLFHETQCWKLKSFLESFLKLGTGDHL